VIRKKSLTLGNINVSSTTIKYQFMLKTLTLIAFSISSILSFSQTPSIDSLKLQLNKTTGEQKIKTLYKLSSLYKSIDSSKARAYTNKGILLALKIDNQNLLTKGKIQDARIDHSYHIFYSSMNKSLEVLNSGFAIRPGDSANVIAMIAAALTEMGAYEHAIQYRKKLYHINSRIKKNQYYPLENIAYLFSEIEVYDSANYYYELALDLTKTLGNNNWEMHCLNNMGYNYLRQNEINKAKDYYQLALDNFKSRTTTISNSDSLLYGVVLGNMAHIHTNINAFNEALNYRNEAILFLSPFTSKELWVRNTLGIVKTYQSLNLFNESNLYLDSILPYLNDNLEFQVRYFNLKAAFFHQNKNYTHENIALKNKIVILDSIVSQKTMDYKINDFTQFQSNKIKNEFNLQRKLREKEYKINSLQLQLTIGLISLLIVIISLIFFNYKKNQKTEQNRLKEKLVNKKSDLTNFAIDITRKQDFIKELLIRLKKIKKSTKIDNEHFESLIFYTMNHTIIDKNLKQFQNNVDEINYEFNSLLEKRFPNLSKNEIQLCSLLRLKLSSKEIASIKNISPNSVKVLRSRLRKKLNIDKSQDLQLFILRIK